MEQTIKTKQIEHTSLQSNIDDLLYFFENDKEKIQNILDDFFLTWSYQWQDSGMVKNEFNKYTHTYVYLKRIISHMKINEPDSAFIK